MTNLLEKTLLTALGAATLSQKKAEELIQELRQKFNVTEEEGKAFLGKVQDLAREERVLDLEAHAQREVVEILGVVPVQRRTERLSTDACE